MRRTLILPFLAASVVSCAGGPTPTGSAGRVPLARGTLFIVGGGSQPRELVAHFVALASVAGRARIAVLPMASGEAEATGREKAEELRTFGAEAFVVNVNRQEA